MIYNLKTLYLGIAMILACHFSSCTKDSDPVVEDMVENSNLFEPFDCVDFLQVDDLSTYCGVDGPSIFITLDGDIARATNGCRYNFGADKQLIFFLSVNVKATVDDARGAVENTIISSGPNDKDKFSKNIEDVGDRARLVGYTDEYDFSHLVLFAHMSNVFIKISTLRSTEEGIEPCTHNEEDKVRFANEVFSMLR